jgi:hypothetical protein
MDCIEGAIHPVNARAAILAASSNGFFVFIFHPIVAPLLGEEYVVLINYLIRYPVSIMDEGRLLELYGPYGAGLVGVQCLQG